MKTSNQEFKLAANELSTLFSLRRNNPPDPKEAEVQNSPQGRILLVFS